MISLLYDHPWHEQWHFKLLRKNVQRKFPHPLSPSPISLLSSIQAVFLRDYFTQYWKSTRDYKRPDLVAVGGKNAMRGRSAANPSRFTRCACLFSKSRKIRDCSYSILGDQGAVTWVGKKGGEVFKNGCERPWDATLNKPVPWLIRMLASDWAQKILSEASIDRAVSLIFL